MDNFLQGKSFHLWMHCIIALLFTILLASCSTTVKRKDGPPHFYVDETKIPNAVPKPERLAKFGNMPFYYVFGQKYYVMKNFKHYREIGTASWYGTLFHHHRTSSGEPYNMLGMTAAHRSLPLPTYVEVTNLRNHRKVIVKVNDRGPFASDRIIDLSYVAAKKLGMIGHGTTKVRVVAIDPSKHGKKYLFAKRGKHRLQVKYHKILRPGRQTQVVQNTSTKILKTENGQVEETQEINQVKTAQVKLIYLQVGAFHNKQHALNLQQRLLSQLSVPIHITTSTAEKLYRVQVGPIHDVALMKAITKQLEQLGIHPNKKDGV